MSAVRSVWLGWGSLLVAGGTIYYFAKKDINAYRRAQELQGTSDTKSSELRPQVDQGDATKKVAEPGKELLEQTPSTTRRKRRTHGDKLG